jgi:hypothetical protein
MRSDGSLAGESDGRGGADAPQYRAFFYDAAVISILIPVAESPPVIQLNIYNNNR